LLTAIMMSGPVLAWIADVMRACNPTAVDGFNRERDAKGLFALVLQPALEQLVGDRHEIDKFEPVQRSSLGKGGSRSGGENSRAPTAHGPCAGALQQPASMDAPHADLLSTMFWAGPLVAASRSSAVA
jgi:hypothetical protein